MPVGSGSHELLGLADGGQSLVGIYPPFSDQQPTEIVTPTAGM
jgi:hypothetical protein